MQRSLPVQPAKSNSLLAVLGGGGGATIGFLTIVDEPVGFVGGYLVTNGWGRPLEFRLSTAVRPNRVQQILYGGTLQPYIFADLIGKTLLEKTNASVQAVLTDREPALDLRLTVDVPVAWLARADDPLVEVLTAAGSLIMNVGEDARLLCHPRYLQDRDRIRSVVESLTAAMELAEPFSRIREALSEARKMGVTSRA